MCASPGGKTAHIADILGATENLDAVDINNERIRILRDRLKLLGIESINVIQADGRTLSSKGYNEYDKILLDPPCSGSGTYSSRPENKWRIQQRDLRWYTNLQRDLLNEASKIIKEGGIIVYSTCSLFSEENHDIISSFLELNTNFTLIEALPMIGLPSQTLDKKAQELYPHLHDTEGFFIAKIRKNE
jgi:16S rRNA (cytosine967-C5)-methyltransferase